MESKHLSYINKVLICNNEILDYLSIEKTIPSLRINNILKSELIIFYFLINKDDRYSEELKDIYELISSNSFYVEGDYVCGKDTKIYIPDAINLIGQNENNVESKNNYYSNNSIRIYNPNIKPKFISFEQFSTILKRDHTNHLINDEVILNDELSYLNKMKDKTNSLLSNLINIVLHNENLEAIDYTELQFLFGLCNIYMVTTYLQDKTELDINVFNISLANTCINKMIYDEEDIEELDSKITKISYRYNHLNSLLNYYKNYVPNSEATINDLEKQLAEVMKKEFELGIELFELKQDPSVFNRHFLNYMIASIKHGTIDYNNTIKDPIISFFDLEGRKLKCYFDIHLSDLLKIIDNVNFLNIINHQQILSKKSTS